MKSLVDQVKSLLEAATNWLYEKKMPESAVGEHEN